MGEPSLYYFNGNGTIIRRTVLQLLSKKEPVFIIFTTRWRRRTLKTKDLNFVIVPSELEMF
jgi:hypothetical protein